MKIKTIAFASLLGLLTAGQLPADPPDLEKEVRIMDSSGDINVVSDATATVADWNNDGRKDLVVGCYATAYIWIYLNEGSDINPVFTVGTYLVPGD